ncbi:5-methylcytosine-specific restriction enzyme subunit McrC [Paenibacillus endophyticus]|uniref:5-methylcytosine-specific restriction enzyme subunit McrC n=1 Tax=Paenibacillus endophyticus TaxID=1294268 RepID=A0A7W5CC73_9BACL|nr:McrC family protein [Paenibacillus endophyticus]MBB3155031.1 5-methylcytosine-specific restriction enzyme subunit McrC [Paenibacillus endophyticus]
MKHIVVTECFDSIPISDIMSKGCLTAVEADELVGYVRKHRLDGDNIIVSRQEIVFINYVGFIQLRSCSIEILPKVSGNDPVQSRRVLLRMLQRSGFLDIHESQISRLTIEKMNLFEIIAYLFTSKLSVELRKGLVRSYRREHGDLQLVKGKIDIQRQVRRESMMQPGVSCVYDEFEVNNPLNQVLKAGLQIVRSRSMNSSTKKKAMSSLTIMDEVDSVLIAIEQLDLIGFDRTNRRYQHSFQLAKLLINRSSPLFSQGGSTNSSILFKMNELFEAYMAYLVRKNWHDVTVHDRSCKLLIKEGSERGVFQLEPDILVINRQGKQIIIDTKWKMIHSDRSRHGVKREDFFQMYAYLTRYKDVSEVVLLYPYHEGINASGVQLESWYLEGEPGKKLKVYSIHYEDEQSAEEELKGMIDSIKM